MGDVIVRWARIGFPAISGAGSGAVRYHDSLLRGSWAENPMI